MKLFKVIWTKNAEYDLERVVEHIKIDSIDTAKNIFHEIKRECDNLYYFLQRKRIIPELEHIGILKYREIIYKRWRIVFKIDNEKVYILLVADSRQNLEDILFRRLIR